MASWHLVVTRAENEGGFRAKREVEVAPSVDNKVAFEAKDRRYAYKMTYVWPNHKRP